jgi:carbon starvation protein CstA
MRYEWYRHRRGWICPVSSGLLSLREVPLQLGFNAMGGWIILLAIYSFLASVLPVWLLLQPRDYLESFKL